MTSVPDILRRGSSVTQPCRSEQEDEPSDSLGSIEWMNGALILWSTYFMYIHILQPPPTAPFNYHHVAHRICLNNDDDVIFIPPIIISAAAPPHR
eukprot:scaffold3544_cov66-Skeletonema_marinoi.AAC.1